MPKKHHKTHRHKDKHNSTSKSSRKHKHEHNEDSKKVKDIFIGKLKVDENACGDCVQTSKKGNSGAENLKKSRDSKDKHSSKKASIADSKRLTEKAVRHHSLENNENSIIKTTKLLFRKEKSFNDAILKTTEPKEDKEKKREKKHKHHSRKVEEKKKTKTETLEDKTLSKELKEKRDKSHKEKHKSKNNSPIRDQTFNRVQEVIFCQVNQTPYKLKNDKPYSEVKGLCRLQRKEHKHSEERCKSNEQKHYKPITDFTVGSVKPELFKFKTREKPEREEYIAQTQYADFHSKSKPSKEHHQKPKTEKPIQDFSEISLGLNEKFLIAEQEKRQKQHTKHHHKHEGKMEHHRKHHSERNESHSKNKHSSEFKSEAFQVEEQKIHKIVENDLKSYFGKIQSLIDRKLDAILHIKQSKQGDSSVKSERSRSGTKEKNSRKVKEPGKVDIVMESDKITKEELVKEVLKYFKENDNSLITCKKVKPDNVGESSQLNTSKETYQTNDSKCKEYRQSTEKHVEEPTKEHSRKRDKTRRSEPPQDFLLSSHKHHQERRSFEREINHQAPTKVFDVDKALQPPKKHKNLVDLSVKHYNSASSSRSFSEQNITASLDPMSKPYLCCASEETVRQKCQKDHRRSSSPNKFLTQMHKSPPKSENRPRQEDRQNEVKEYSSISPPQCPSSHAMPFLQDIFLPPENFRSPQKDQFIVQGVEPPISETKNSKRSHVKKLECKTMSIVAIKSQKEPNELSIITQTQANIKTRKPSNETELVERRKLSKRYRLYYNYSELTTDNDEDGKSIISDTARVISDPSEEVLLKENLKQSKRRLKAVELETPIPKKWNRISTPRNSHLNNIIEEPSDIKNDDYFVPLGGTEEVYHRILTSSHSDYCFKVDRKQANSNVSIQSRDTEYCAEPPVNMALERCYKPRQSRSDCQLTSNVRRRHPVYISKSDIFIDGNCGKKVMKTIFMADTRRFSPKIKPRSRSNVKKDIRTTFSKECQTTDVTPLQQKITKTKDAVDEGISKKNPILTTNVAVSSHILDTKAEDTKPLKRRSPETVEIAVGPLESKFQNSDVVDVAVGPSEENLPVKPKVQRKKVDIRTRKSIAVSPVRFAEEVPVHNPPKSPLRKFVIQKPPNPAVPKFQPQTKPKPPLERSPLRTPQTPRVAEIKRTPCITAKPILVPPNRVIKAPETTPTPEETCVRLFHSKEKNINLSTKKSQATKGASAKPSPVRTSAFKHAETKKPFNTPSVVESCFLHCDPTEKDVLETGTANKHPVIVGTATCGFQPGAKIVSGEGSTSSSVSDADPRPIRRSKSLVELDKTKKITFDKSKSDICRIKKVLISDLLNTTDNSFISDRMEKFTNKPNLRCTSKSHGSSLDNYIKGKFTSRLFLTKDYKAGAMSSYQKRKLYDEARRQKMKKNSPFRKDVEVGPQVFEVHFLSMINQSKHNEQSLQTPLVNFADAPTSNNQLVKVKATYSKRIAVDENHQLKTICKKIMSLSGFDTELLKGATCTCREVSTQCSSCKAFVALIDKLHASLEKYKTDSGHSYKAVEPEEPTTHLQKIEEIYPTCFNKSSNESAPDEVASAFNMVDSVKPIIPEIESSEDLILLPQPMSCPVLATNSSSFEFLYEETTSLTNEPLARGALLADLLKPFDQSFDLHTNQYNVEMPYFRNSSYGSTTASIESGYASIKSKSCCANSLISFFKKPNISALFRPPSSNTNRSEVTEKSLVYEKMTKSCQLYAKKVRAVSEMKIQGDTEEFQEFSLKFLLSNDGSVLLGSGVSVLSLRSLSQQNVNESIVTTNTDVLDGLKGYNVVFPNESLNTQVSVYLDSDVVKNEKKRTDNPVGVKSSSVMYGEFLAALSKAYDAHMAECNLMLDDVDVDGAVANALRERKNEEKNNRGLKKLFSKKSIDTRKEFEDTASQVEVFNDKSVMGQLQHLATNSRKCFTMLADAVKINDGIDNELKICGLLKMLQRMESGDFLLEQVAYSCNKFKYKVRDTDPETCIRNQILESIIALYEMGLKDKKKFKKKCVSEKLKLIKLLVVKYRVGLLYRTDAIVVLIWRGVINTESQLKAAVIFLLRSNTANIDPKQLEEYCKCTK